jgi:hypothetical protein
MKGVNAPPMTFAETLSSIPGLNLLVDAVNGIDGSIKRLLGITGTT